MSTSLNSVLWTPHLPHSSPGPADLVGEREAPCLSNADGNRGSVRHPKKGREIVEVESLPTLKTSAGKEERKNQATASGPGLRLALLLM